MVVHLPRLRSDVAWGQSAPNLSRFVRTHFPSRDVGVFDDFWKRVVPVTDANGQVVGIPFTDSDPGQQPAGRGVRGLAEH